MVHNGIEYGLMQAYAEGFDILKGKNSTELPEAQRYDLDLADIAEGLAPRFGGVVVAARLSAAGLAKSPKLDNYSGEVSDSGEGRWTIEAAIEEAVRPMSCRPRCTRVSARVRITPLVSACCRRCVLASAGTSSRSKLGRVLLRFDSASDFSGAGSGRIVLVGMPASSWKQNG